MLFIREDIPCKYIKQITLNNSFEGFFVELNLRSKEWLLGSSYNHHKANIAFHLSNVSVALDKLCADYENFILLGDFNVEVKEKNISDFMSTYILKSLVKQKTCFKNHDKPSCIDLILTNSSRSFQDNSVFETGLSDFHKLTTTVLKQYFPIAKLKIVNYRDYRNFRNDEFRAELDNDILKHDINNIEYQHFLNIIIEILNKQAPMKIKYLRANHGKFMTKRLHKAIMKRSRLRNKFLPDRTETSGIEYKKQRNFCVNLLKKAQKDHSANLDVNSVLDNRKFWQNVKPLFSNKVKAKTTIKLIENDETIDNEIKIAKIFNEYFVNTVKKLGILTEMESATFTENSLREVEMTLKKYKNHPSITAITKRMKSLGNFTFSFNFISHDNIVKELNKLKTKKASQKTDIPIKIVKENVDIISHFLYHNFNNVVLLYLSNWHEICRSNTSPEKG